MTEDARISIDLIFELKTPNGHKYNSEEQNEGTLFEVESWRLEWQTYQTRSFHVCYFFPQLLTDILIKKLKIIIYKYYI